MRRSQAFIPTLREQPADAQIASHVLMVRGGYIRQLAAGVYNYLPLGWRVIRNIEAIVRQEMDGASAQEVLMPAAIPSELWQESGRWKAYGPELLRFQDRKGAAFCFGPTHEEVIVDMVRRDTKSYRELPLNLYQIQGKFRDELRPRAGLMRGREFIMKDAYSFDVDEAGANRSYDQMYAAYERIFARCGLDFRVVEADTGAIGGSRSHEFQVLAESGEDAIVACDHCAYAANVEQADLCEPTQPGIVGASLPVVSVATPAVKTIAEVAECLGVDASQIIKTLVYMADGDPVVVLVRGDRVINEVRLKRLLGADELFLAREGQVKKAMGVPSGFVGPLGTTLPVFADVELQGATGAVCGGNEIDTHLQGVELERDVPNAQFASLRLAQPGETCPRCESGQFRAFRGIEVGHVFFLGTKYSVAMQCTVLDERGSQVPVVMGCYGIGITRIAAAAIEQNHDDNGIVWPLPLAPFEVTVLPLQMSEQAVVDAAADLYKKLQSKGIDVLLDDRDERPGAKFKDADLIGIPMRIAIGTRSLKSGYVELKWRHEEQAQHVPMDGVVDAICGALEKERSKFERRTGDF